MHGSQKAVYLYLCMAPSQPGLLVDKFLVRITALSLGILLVIVHGYILPADLVAYSCKALNKI